MSRFEEVPGGFRYTDPDGDKLTVRAEAGGRGPFVTFECMAAGNEHAGIETWVFEEDLIEFMSQLAEVVVEARKLV